MAVPGELTKLVESERRLDAELAAVRGEAESLVQEAHRRAHALDRRLDADIAEAGARLRAQIDAEQITALAAVQADARLQVQRYDVAAGRAASFADLVVARLITAGPT